LHDGGLSPVQPWTLHGSNPEYAYNHHPAMNLKIELLHCSQVLGIW